MSGFYNQPFKRKSTSLTTLLIVIVVIVGLVLGIRAYISDVMEETDDKVAVENNTDDLKNDVNLTQNVDFSKQSNIEENQVNSEETAETSQEKIDENALLSKEPNDKADEKKLSKNTEIKQYDASKSLKRSETTTYTTIKKETKLKNSATSHQSNRITHEVKRKQNNFKKSVVVQNDNNTNEVSKTQADNENTETKSKTTEVATKQEKNSEKAEKQRPDNFETIDQIVKKDIIKEKKRLTVVDKDYETRHAFNPNKKSNSKKKNLNDDALFKKDNKKSVKSKISEKNNLRPTVNPILANSVKRKDMRDLIITSEVTALDNQQKKKERVK